MSAPSPSDTLSQWLNWLEQLHPTEIDMGLQRVGQVANRLQLRPATMPVILVGGTNGKGSTVALLTEIYRHAGFKVGAYTSPHIDVFNERMCVDAQMLNDQVIVDALHTVESAREPETLTYFEYTTLAAMAAFTKQDCDVVVMEVGLGGRLDATNLWDADCAILTSIALDHQDYLGDTIEAIAAEKVAIGRSGKPLIVGEQNPPDNLIQIAKGANMDIQFINENALPNSALAGVHQQRNAACALLAVASLQEQLPVSDDHIQQGLASVHVQGRFEQKTIDSQLVVLDVAHNPAAAITVREALLANYAGHDVYAVFSALKDKDIEGIVEALAPAVSRWYCAQLPVPRATPLSDLVETISSLQPGAVKGFTTVRNAWHAARADAQSRNNDKPVLVLVAGSFYTLSQLGDEAGDES